MSAKYVRDYYRVPAKRGMRIVFDGRPAIIVGFRGQYLRVKLLTEHGLPVRSILTIHPTWHVEYPEMAASS